MDWRWAGRSVWWEELGGVLRLRRGRGAGVVAWLRRAPGPARSVQVQAGARAALRTGNGLDPRRERAADASSRRRRSRSSRPESENRCLLTYDRALDCPSVIGPIAIGVGPDGGTEFVVAQRGISPGDDRCLLRPHIHRRRRQRTVTRGVAPYPFRSGPHRDRPDGGSSSSSFVLSGEDDAMTSSDCRSDRRWRLDPVPSRLAFRLSIFTAATGGIFATRTNGQVLLLRGLPSAPRLVVTTTTIPNFGITTDPSGEPVGPLSETSTLHLLEGETFARERWSMGTRTGGLLGATLELAYVTSGRRHLPVFITRANESGRARAFCSHDATKTTGFPFLHTAKIGESYSTCSAELPRRDLRRMPRRRAVPRRRRQHHHHASSRAASVFTYVAHDIAEDASPTRGTPCPWSALAARACSRRSRGSSLIVPEAFDSGATRGPLIVERMCLPLAPLGFVPAELRSLAARPDGDMDVGDRAWFSDPFPATRPRPRRAFSRRIAYFDPRRRSPAGRASLVLHRHPCARSCRRERRRGSNKKRGGPPCLAEPSTRPLRDGPTGS